MSNLIFEEALKELNELDDDDFVDPDAIPDYARDGATIHITMGVADVSTVIITKNEPIK